MKKDLLATAGMLLFLSLPVSAQNEKVTNEVIISLLKEGFSDEEIIGYIENCSDRALKADLSSMRALKAAGANSELITFIQKTAKVDFGYEGILWWNPSDGGKPKKLHRTAFEKESSGGWGGIVALAGAATGIVPNNAVGTIATVGLLSSSASIKKVVMQGSSAKTVLTGENAEHPIFRFYFPKQETDSFEKTADSWYFNMMSAIESPNEFQCIRMRQKKNKRTFPEGISYSAMGFTAKKASRDIIDFEIKDLSNNVFEVSFPDGLEPGEYCFFYKNGLNNEWFAEHMFGFDFSVQ